jgi:protein-disulfide isomerase
VKNKIILIVVVFFTLISLFFIGRTFYQQNKTEEAASLAQRDFKKFVPDYAPKLGTSTPEVYLIEFLDPECESCREFYPYVKMLLEEFDGRIQLVVRYAPFHPNSVMVIKILEAARKQGKYWETLETLFRYQPQWGSHHDPKPDLIWNYLPEAGVDIARIKSDMNDPEIEKMIENEKRDLQDLGVKATPQFFVNGEPLQVFGVEPLRDLIKQKLSTP